MFATTSGAHPTLLSEEPGSAFPLGLEMFELAINPAPERSQEICLLDLQSLHCLPQPPCLPQAAPGG